MIISYVQVRYEVDMKCFLPKWAVQHLAKVTWMKVIENPFMIKVSRWLISSCLYFTDAGWGIWCFPKKNFPTVFWKMNSSYLLSALSRESVWSLRLGIEHPYALSSDPDVSKVLKPLKRCGLQSWHGPELDSSHKSEDFDFNIWL